MSTRTRTIASFFTVAMAAMLLGSLVTNHIQRPQLAQARPLDSAVAAEPRPAAPTGPVTFDTFKEIARRETPGVVNVNTSKVVKRPKFHDPFKDFFGGGDDMLERFFGPQGGPDRQTQTSLGSGFVVDKDGFILTNRHVVEGADQINVTLASGKRYEAKLVGKDARTDVALLKIEPKEALITLALGDSDEAEVGEWVMAIGNPFGLDRSVTVGVVSFKGRNIPLGTPLTGVDMIQTDAAINPGNSGGPLINTRGEVIGINTLIYTQGAPQSAGVGFAVPINVAKEILPQLRERGRVVRGWLGVQIQPVTEDMAKTFKMAEPKGAVVSDVTDKSPAEKAGVEPGDVVVGVDGRKVDGPSDLSRYVASKAPGTAVKLDILRKGSQKTIAVGLGSFPDESDKPEGEERKGKLGMTLRDLTPDLAERLDIPRQTKGVVVMEVEPGEAPEQAGLQQRDVIVSVNGNPVSDVDSLESEIGKARADGLARLRVRRGGGHVFLVLKLR